MQKLSVPLLKQGQLECGPTSLKMVLEYYNEHISLQTIIKGVGGLHKYIGVKTIKLADYAKKLGYTIECYSYNKNLAKGKADIRRPSKQDIIKFLKKRTPVIIAVRSYILHNIEGKKQKFSDLGHFIVITGYRDRIFCYNNPEDGKSHNIKEDDLMFAWLNNVLDSSAYLLVLKPKK